MLKRILKSTLLAMVAWLMLAGVVLAAWEFMFPTTITDTSGASRAYYPVMLGYGGQALVDSGKIASSGNDTNMQISGSDIKYMMSTTNCTAVVPSLPAGGTTTVNLYTGYTPLQSGFPIITGSGGNVTVSDNVSLELGDNSVINLSGWMNTSNGSGKNLVYKEDAFRTYISAEDSIASEIVSPGVDVGAAAINRASTGGSGETVIGKDNPANLSGRITSVEIWAASNIGGMRVGSFYLVGGTTYKCRDSETIGAVTSGSKQTFSDLSIEIRAGDYLGCYFTSGTIERDTAGFAGMYYYTGEAIDPDDQVVYNLAANYAISLYGTGEEYAEVTATGVDDGEHDATTQIDSPFLSLGIDTSGNITPVSGNLTLNAPMWQIECDVDPFTSIDSNVHTCDIVGATWTSDGYSFDGTNDYIDCGNAASLNITGEITLEAWVYLSATWAAPGEIVCKRDGAGQNFSFYLEGGRRVALQGGAAVDGTYSNIPYPAVSTWHHLVGVIDGTTGSIYINGELNKSDSIDALATHTANVSIGARGDSPSAVHFKGIIGEVRIYNRALTPTEISQNYNATKSKYAVGDIYTHSTLVSVPDNANDLILCQKDVMSYADNITLSVNGTQVLWFAPTVMLSGNIVPDRVGYNHYGTIAWGSNSNVDINYGEMSSYEDYTVSVGAIGGFDMPTSPLPATWFNPSGDVSPSLPFYDVFSEVAAQTGKPLQMYYAQAIIGVAIGVFLLVVLSTRSALLAYVSLVIVLVIGSSMTIIPWWIIFAVIITGVAIMYLFRQVAY